MKKNITKDTLIQKQDKNNVQRADEANIRMPFALSVSNDTGSVVYSVIIFKLLKIDMFYDVWNVVKFFLQ